MAGLFFCLASAEGAGLLFCPAAIQPRASVYSAFCVVYATIPPTPQSGAQGFTGAFPAIQPVFPLLCGGASCYAVQSARRWRTHQRRSAPHQYQILPLRRALYRAAQRPIIIMYIRARPCYRSMPNSAAYRRPCQPGGVSMLPTPGGLQSGTGSAVRGRLAARNHWQLSPYLFPGFRPIANRGRQ